MTRSWRESRSQSCMTHHLLPVQSQDEREPSCLLDFHCKGLHYSVESVPPPFHDPHVIEIKVKSNKIEDDEDNDD